MKKLILLLLTTILIVNICAKELSFQDVPKDHWSYDAVNSLFEKGIIRGKRFSGDEFATRYYFATILARLFDEMQNSNMYQTNIAYEDFERINRLSIEFANELNLFGYKLSRVRAEIEKLKTIIKAKKQEIEEVRSLEGGPETTYSYDYRFRHENIDYSYAQDNGSVDKNDISNNNHVFGMNYTTDWGNGMTLSGRTEYTHDYHNAAGNDFNIGGNTSITSLNLNFEEGMHSFSIGRQFFTISNALVFSNKGNGLKYSKILNEDTDLILMATNDGGSASSALNNFAINYLMYQENGTFNLYFLNSHSIRWNNASALISTDGTNTIWSTVPTVNYFGLSYKTEKYKQKYFAEVSLMEYNDTVKDYTTNGATGSDIGMQMAYQFGLTKTINPSLDMKFIYTHFDDFFKRYSVDSTITAPYYDELGYGGISGAEALSDIRSAGFSSIFLRFEKYLSLRSTLSLNFEIISDDSTLAAGQVADDRTVVGLKLSKNVKDAILSFEYTMVDVEDALAPSDVKINGTGQESLPIPSVAANLIDGDLFDPIDQNTFRITMTYNF